MKVVMDSDCLIKLTRAKAKEVVLRNVEVCIPPKVFGGQKKAITYLKEHGKIDRKTYSTICGVEKTLAYEELTDMINKELLGVAGSGKGIYYILRTKRTNCERIEKMGVY